jgi:GTP:adenosylcobinamide-phosphate guanylyltransferase
MKHTVSDTNGPFNVIILAGGTGGPLTDATGVEEKALLELHGKPMLEWVVEAFRHSSLVNQIVVVGSDSLKDLACMQHVRKRIFQGLNLEQNLLHAVGYVKARLYEGRRPHNGYVISFCDAVFLNPELVTETLQAIRDAEADVVLHYVERSTFEAADLPAKRTYIPIEGGEYTGSTIYYVRQFSKILGHLTQLSKMRKHRKDPQGILRVLGCEGDRFEDIEQALSATLDAKVRICVSPHAELGMDVDKPSDYELAKEVLA